MDELLLLSIEHDVIRIPLLVYFTPVGLAHFYRKPCNQVTGHECNNAEIAFTLLPIVCLLLYFGLRSMGNCNHDREEQTLEFLTLIQKGWSYLQNLSEYKQRELLMVTIFTTSV